MFTPHEVLKTCVEERLKSLGYKVLRHDEAPKWIRDVGSPDIVAEKNGEYVLVEVKPSDQLKRYSRVRARLILVTTDVDEGGAIEVWGLRELEK